MKRINAASNIAGMCASFFKRIVCGVWALCAVSVPAQAHNAIEGHEAIASLASFVELSGNTYSEAEARKLLLADKVAGPSVQQVLASAKRLGLNLETRQITLSELMRQNVPAILLLRQQGRYVTLSAVGRDYSFVSNQVVSNKALAGQYKGVALVLPKVLKSKPTLWIDNPVRLVKATSSVEEVEQTLSVINHGSRPVKFKVIGTSCGCTDARIASTLLAPGQKTLLTVRMRASGWGSKTESATFETDDPLRPRFIVAVQAELPKHVAPNPERLRFVQIEGQSDKRMMTLLLPGKATITRISSQLPFLSGKVTGTEPAYGGSLRVIEVSSAGTAPTGDSTGELIFDLSGAEVPSVRIGVQVSVAPDLVVEPRQVFLGRVVHGLAVNKVAVVRSSGDHPFSIKSIKTSSSSIKARAGLGLAATAHSIEIEVSTASLPKAFIEGTVHLETSTGRVIDVRVSGMVSEVNASSNQRSGLTRLQVGQEAPDFTIEDMHGNTIRLSEHKKRNNVLLTFFPRCFTGGCAGQMSSLQAEIARFKESDTQILAVSVDSPKDQLAFAAKLGLGFPLLPDTQRNLSMLYGAAEQPTDLARRMTVLIDKQGMVRLVDTEVNVHAHGTDMIAKMRELGLAK